MKVLVLTAAVTTLLAAPAAWAQSEAEYYSYEEQALPADDVDEMANAPDVSGVDVSSEGASSGESGLGEEDYDVAPPEAPVPEE
ncbi:MAG: hypothetical protein JSS54_12990 [Proteobacteria bacterium]|nr:hypothetical protein [Pseudomonadota bacterium]MBS0269880.1 hypothetical protein [Pseudomonadota bacterium]